MHIDELIESIKELTLLEWLEQVRDSIDVMYDYLASAECDEATTHIITRSVTKLFLIADDEITPKSIAFMNILFDTNHTIEELNHEKEVAIKSGFKDSILHVISFFNEDAKIAVIVIAICIFTLKGYVSDNNYDLIDKIIPLDVINKDNLS